MDPTQDPVPVPPPTTTGASTPSDLAAVMARLDRIEQRLDAVEWNQRTLIAYLPVRFRAGVAAEPARPTGPPAERPSVPAPVFRVPAVEPDVRPSAPIAVPAPPPAAAPIAAAVPPPATASVAAAAPMAAAAETFAEPTGAIDQGEDADEAWTATPGTRWQPHATEPTVPSVSLPDLRSLSPGQLLAWVGGAALVLGAVFFLSMAFSRGWITEPMRVLIGLISGAALMGASVVTFDRRGPVVGHVLAAVGIAVLELTLYAARLFALVPAEVSLLGAGVVAAAAMVIAIRFDSQPVAALGLLAVLAAPPIMSAPASLLTVAFLLVVLTAAAVVALARGWRWLPWLAFATTLPQLAAWVWGSDLAFLITGGAILGWWAILAGSAVGEMWRRPRTLQSDPSALLLVVADVAVLVLLVATGAQLDAIGIATLVMGIAHVALALPFVRLRDVADELGQLLVGIAAPWLALGILLAFPDLLVPAALAGLAAAMGAVAWRRSHRFALVEGLAAVAIAAGWILQSSFPIREMATSFPPVGLQGQDAIGSVVVVASLLAVIAAASRWSATTRLGRSCVLAAGALFGLWVVPFVVGGLWLVVAWTLLGVAIAIATLRVWRVRLVRLSLPLDPLLLAGWAVVLAAVAWGIAGFALPTGTVDILSSVVIDRIIASLVPVVGLIALLLALRPRWWRGVVASCALVLLTLGAWLVAGSASLRISTLATLDGAFIVLVAWSTLALVALVLDERPRLRLASVPLLTSDPAGHPLALTAAIPFFATLLWLFRNFLAGGAAGGVPAQAFVDAPTAATCLVVAFLLIGAAIAVTRLVRTVLVVTAVVLVAVLLPIELPLELAVVGWSVMAAATMLVGRRFSGAAEMTARALAGGLITVGVAATLLSIAPPDRLLLEATRVPPTAGPPNAATLAGLALAGAIAVAAWCLRGDRRIGPWLGLAAAGAVGWVVSIGIADAFAIRMPDALDPTEVARQAQVALSIAWAAMGLGTLLVGLVRDIAPARQGGLALLAIATVKVFLYDLATLDIAYRVLSLVGLGLLLLVAAWFYLHARREGLPHGR